MMGGYGYGGVPPAGPSNYWGGVMRGGMMGGYWYSNGPNGSSYPYWGMMGDYGYPGYVWNGTASGTLVTVFNYGFHPATLTVSRGTTVTWVNMDFVQHTVTSGSEQAPTGLFDSHELSHMQSFSYTFNAPGTYTYFCDVHPDMVGTVIVK
jgi:plastocyanin